MLYGEPEPVPRPRERLGGDEVDRRFNRFAFGMFPCSFLSSNSTVVQVTAVFGDDVKQRAEFRANLLLGGDGRPRLVGFAGVAGQHQAADTVLAPAPAPPCDRQ